MSTFRGTASSSEGSVSRLDRTEYADCERYALPMRGRESNAVVIDGRDCTVFRHELDGDQFDALTDDGRHGSNGRRNASK